MGVNVHVYVYVYVIVCESAWERERERKEIERPQGESWLIESEIFRRHANDFLYSTSGIESFKNRNRNSGYSFTFNRSKSVTWILFYFNVWFDLLFSFVIIFNAKHFIVVTLNNILLMCAYKLWLYVVTRRTKENRNDTRYGIN